MAACGQCGGSGEVPLDATRDAAGNPYATQTCQACFGTGRDDACPACCGDGITGWNVPCPDCGGSGFRGGRGNG